MNYKNYINYSIQKIFGSYSINIEKGNYTKSFYDVQEDIIDIIKYLEKENQELKKQLEESIKSYTEENALRHQIDLELDKAKDELYMLKNKYCIRLKNNLSEGIEPDPEDFYLAEIEGKANDYDKLLNQQKEFIEFLENMIIKEKEDLNTIIELMKLPKEDLEHNGAYKVCISFITKLEEILSKYKEIIGDDE